MTSLTPQQLRLEGDGGMGAPRYGVEWTGESLRYELTDERTGAHDVVELAPGERDWRRFWSALERAGVWDWSSEYDDFSAVDAPSWSVEISFGDRQVRSAGMSSYPPDPLGPDEAPDGLASESEPTRSLRLLRGGPSAGRRPPVRVRCHPSAVPTIEELLGRPRAPGPPHSRAGRGGRARRGSAAVDIRSDGQRAADGIVPEAHHVRATCSSGASTRPASTATRRWRATTAP